MRQSNGVTEHVAMLNLPGLARRGLASGMARPAIEFDREEDPAARIAALERELADAKGQLGALQAERERNQLQTQLTAALKKFVVDPAAAEDGARVLATEAKNVAGQVMVGTAIGVEAIAQKYADERPWLTAPRNGSGAGETVIAFDPVRAENDVEYLQDWKKRDPEGVRKAWNGHIAKRAKIASR